MKRYITLGADENGQVYGLELGEDGGWRHNSLGYCMSCDVIRPVSKERYEYMTEDPESAKELWQSCVAADRTELGLEEWFNEYISNDNPFDVSSVSELLDYGGNPTVAKHGPDFRKYLERRLVRARKVTEVVCEDDVYEWEASGFFPPKRPFVVELAPKALLEKYYAHLRKTCKEFEG